VRTFVLVYVQWLDFSRSDWHPDTEGEAVRVMVMTTYNQNLRAPTHQVGSLRVLYQLTVILLSLPPTILHRLTRDVVHRPLVSLLSFTGVPRRCYYIRYLKDDDKDKGRLHGTVRRGGDSMKDRDYQGTWITRMRPGTYR
jgi:hypothetical protein